MDFVKLNRDSRALLGRLADRLPETTLQACRSFETGGEWGELIELISATLVKNGIRVTEDERDALAELLYMYPVPVEGYEYISNRDETLAALNVAEG